MKNYRYYCLSLLFGVITISAQDNAGESVVKSKAEASNNIKAKDLALRVINGRVIDAITKLPKSGVIVRVVGYGGYSSLTNDDGTYELKIPKYATAIEVSTPDYNIVKKGLGKSDNIGDICIYHDTYKNDYTKEANLLSENTANGFQYSDALTIEDEIQKNLGAIVHTTTRNGTPGVGSVMFLNGISSLNVNAQPLIVVDGVIFDQQYGRSMLHEGFYNDILSNISPADIDKVTVLRNGTAIYGTKGANGVILIETKRSKSMATRITASLSGGFSLEPNHYSMMDGDQYRTYASELLGTTNTVLTDFKFLNDQPNYYYNKYHNNTDWNDLLYHTAFQQNYNINVEGGDVVAKYNLSLGYTTQESTLKYNDMSRLNIRFNTDIDILKNLSVKFDVSFANQTRNLRDDGAPESYSEGTPTSPSFLGYAKSPMLSPYTYANGELSTNHTDIDDEDYLNEALSGYSNYNYKLANPIAINEYGDAENKNRFENSMFNISIKPTFNFNKQLSLSEQFSYNLVNSNEKYYIPLNGVPSYYVSSVGDYRENEVRSLVSKQNSVMSDTRLKWANQYGEHSIEVFGGARIISENYKLDTQVGYNTGNDKTPFTSSSLLNASTTGINDSWNSLAWYLQGTYNYRQRYFVQTNLTAEGSSKFGKDCDSGIKAFDAVWGIFPGVQASWVLSNENFMSEISFVDYLKLTAGYDVSGNDDIDVNAARSYFSAKRFLDAISGLTFSNIGNTKIQWETTKRFNVGLEGNFFNNRLHATVNLFSSKVDNLLTYQSLNFLTGLDSNWSNGGKMKNKGFDISLVGKVLNIRNFQWELGASLGHYKNEITDLPDGKTAIDTKLYGATIRSAIGGVANAFYGYKSEGVFSSTEEATAAGLYILGDNGISKTYFGAGDVKFADLDGNHEINSKDMTVIGDPNPDIYGNIFTSFCYKKFKLDFNFNYSVGNDVYNYMRCQLESGSRFMNQTTSLTNRWQVEGQITDVPKATFQDPMGNSRFSNRWIEDGSYLKLKTITLSYDLPVNSTFFQGFEFWIQANNVFTISKYLGTDPENAMSSSVIGQGIDLGRLPLCRNFVAGVKIKL